MKTTHYSFFSKLSLFILISHSVFATEKSVHIDKSSTNSNYYVPADLVNHNDRDSKLQEAMNLYYNRQYRLALPLLQTVALKDDRTEVLFWLGRAAYETGQSQLAIEKYQQILKRDPKLSRVRLELAAAYAQAGNKDAAEVELKSIAKENPGSELNKKIENTLTEIREPTQTGQRFFSVIRASIGPEYDSNINVGPRDEVILLSQNRTITSKTLDGWLVKFNVNAESLYDFGSPNGFVWHNRLQFQHNEYPGETNSRFNYTQTDVYTGLDYYANKYKARLPIGFIDRRFSNESLSRAYYFNPNLEINVLHNTDFALSYRFENEDFTANQYDALIGQSHTGSFGPRHKFEALDAQHSLALFGTFGRRNSNADRFSFYEWSVGPSYFAHFKTGTDLYFDFKYLNRDYDAPALLFEDKGKRLDHRYAISFSLSQTFKKYYYVSLNYNYIDNNSNTPLFAYDKNMIGLNVGTNLNF